MILGGTRLQAADIHQITPDTLGDLNRMLAEDVQGGDEIRFAPGDYADLVLRAPAFDTPVRLTGAQQGARLNSLVIQSGRNLVIEDLSLWPEQNLKQVRHVIRVEPAARDIVLQRLDLRTTQQAAAYPGWSLEQWTRHKRAGILVRGSHVTMRANRLVGFGVAIGSTGDHNRVVGNVITGFSGDAIRAIGHYNQVIGNDIRDCAQIDENHDDGIQSWSRGPDGRSGRGSVRGLRISGNRIVEWSAPGPAPLRCSLQGIGLFDGLYEDLQISDNLIVVSAFHGISVYGGRNVKILHNTVVNSRGPSTERPWIGVYDHRRGGEYRDVVVANNVAPRFQYQARRSRSLTETRNLVAPYPQRVFANAAGGDFSPGAAGGLRDGGDPAHATPRDILGRPRPQGRGPDIGAFEGGAP